MDIQSTNILISCAEHYQKLLLDQASICRQSGIKQVVDTYTGKKKQIVTWYHDSTNTAVREYLDRFTPRDQKFIKNYIRLSTYVRE